MRWRKAEAGEEETCKEEQDELLDLLMHNSLKKKKAFCFQGEYM